MSGASARDATLLGFDYGEKRIGVAIGNALTRSARALVVIPNLNREHRFKAVGDLLAEIQHAVHCLLVRIERDGPGLLCRGENLLIQFANPLGGRLEINVEGFDG